MTMKKEITELLGNNEVQPSARCWESINQQLTAMQTPAQSQPDVSATQQAGTGLKQTLLQKGGLFWAKAATIVAASATAITVTVVAIVNSNQPKVTTQEPNPTTIENPVIEIEDDTTAPFTEESAVFTEIKETEKPITKKVTTPEVTDQATAPASSEPVAINPAPAVTAPATHQPVTTQPSTNSVAATPQQTPTQPVAKKSEPVTTEAPKKTQTVTQSISEDPVFDKIQEEEINNQPTVSIEIPNVFTPNGDGYNDYFVIKGIEHCTKAELVVRNSGKKVVFHSKHYDNTWNADFAEDGIYYYTFSYEINGIQQIRQGIVNIIRE